MLCKKVVAKNNIFCEKGVGVKSTPFVIVMINSRWFYISFAFLGVLINYLDRTALSYAIKKSIFLSNN